ncbi:unnamed protein product [Darwinula stevensoni]|uniref:Uncharacterized protein n=1 Tax=Darwinula stevensoni TaxID=69355 RepID=A0A7R9FSE3_9CRUS|nr:unnamed protein product [Darwinula stevensoni]CAG0903570.1 unnamed protein product [Darwinula stevensoni]
MAQLLQHLTQGSQPMGDGQASGDKPLDSSLLNPEQALGEGSIPIPRVKLGGVSGVGEKTLTKSKSLSNLLDGRSTGKKRHRYSGGGTGANRPLHTHSLSETHQPFSAAGTTHLLQNIVSVESKRAIGEILERVNDLNETEKLLLYLQLPSGKSADPDPLKLLRLCWDGVEDGGNELDVDEYEAAELCVLEWAHKFIGSSFQSLIHLAKHLIEKRLIHPSSPLAQQFLENKTIGAGNQGIGLKTSLSSSSSSSSDDGPPKRRRTQKIGKWKKFVSGGDRDILREGAPTPLTHTDLNTGIEEKPPHPSSLTPVPEFSTASTNGLSQPASVMQGAPVGKMPIPRLPQQATRASCKPFTNKIVIIPSGTAKSSVPPVARKYKRIQPKPQNDGSPANVELKLPFKCESEGSSILGKAWESIQESSFGCGSEEDLIPPNEKQPDEKNFSELRMLLEGNIKSPLGQMDVKRRVSFTPHATESITLFSNTSGVPPSPGARRRAFDFTPIVPSSATGSPFISPRGTPVSNVRSRHNSGQTNPIPVNSYGDHQQQQNQSPFISPQGTPTPIGNRSRHNSGFLMRNRNSSGSRFQPYAATSQLATTSNPPTSVGDEEKVFLSPSATIVSSTNGSRDNSNSCGLPQSPSDKGSALRALLKSDAPPCLALDPRRRHSSALASFQKHVPPQPPSNPPQVPVNPSDDAYRSQSVPLIQTLPDSNISPLENQCFDFIQSPTQTLPFQEQDNPMDIMFSSTGLSDFSGLLSSQCDDSGIETASGGSVPQSCPPFRGRNPSQQSDLSSISTGTGTGSVVEDYMNREPGSRSYPNTPIPERLGPGILPALPMRYPLSTEGNSNSRSYPSTPVNPNPPSMLLRPHGNGTQVTLTSLNMGPGQKENPLGAKRNITALLDLEGEEDDLGSTLADLRECDRDFSTFEAENLHGQ